MLNIENPSRKRLWELKAFDPVLIHYGSEKKL